MPASTDLAEVLSAWDDTDLEQLLGLRPDLAHPAPSSLTALASRAGARASVARAMATLDAPGVSVLETLVLLAESQAPTRRRLAAAVGFETGRAVGELLDLALVVEDSAGLWPVPAAADCLGPHPLGLGPRLSDLGVPPAEGWPTTAQAVRSVRAQAPEAARRMLDALTWGPPVGKVSRDIPPGARWLLDNHVLVRTSATELTLPREVALAARGARLAPPVPDQPPVDEAPQREERTVAAEAARAAETLLDRVEALVRAWSRDPAAVLRSGGVGVREVHRWATHWQVSTAQAALVMEVAGRCGLLGQIHDEEGAWWTGADGAATWAGEEPAGRWAQIAAAWITWPRTPWLAGTRTDKQVLRAALEPGLQRSWAPVLRRRVLLALAQWPQGAAPSVQQVRDHLGWHTAKAVPPESAVEAILAETAALGLTGAGALATTGRMLLKVATDSTGAITCCQDPPAEVSVAGVGALAEELESLLPPAVAEMIIQGDLTAVVPGRPTLGLRALVESVAEVESREPATTLRFTPDSIRRGLESGTESGEPMAAEDLLEQLRAASATPLPQPLEYLVRDVARSHETVRVGSAGAYVRSEDPAALTRLLEREELAHLGLRPLAPTVLLARADARSVAAAMSEAGVSSLVEGPDGEPVQLPEAGRAPVPPVRPGNEKGETAAPAAAVVQQMRAGEQRAREVLRARAEQPAPADALEALRLAARQGATVELEMAGPRGEVQSRRVRPLRVDPGRIRVLDVRRDAEITVAPHRIAAVRSARATHS